ncbi:YecA family protein [Rummeliibacillus pycnus]|uniref:YecA family protein n=1 Tax=Rummeliibacillus pycnus TaxID=101070 RepID=UPI0037CB3D54
MEKIASLEEILGVLPSYILSNGIYTVEEESLCPCGKGEKYKDCCLDKREEIFNIYNSSEHKQLERNAKIGNYLNSRKVKNIPSFKLYKKSLEKKNVAFCLASNSNTPCSNEGIRYAHTLAESSVLKVFSENQKNLFTFNRYLNFPSDSLDDYFVSIKTKEASIVNTFCGNHDKKLFKEIENGNIYKSEPLQELQLALNAAALRVYGLILQIMLSQKMLVELEELWIETGLHNDYASYIKELKKSIEISNKLVSDIENNHTSDLFAFSLELKGEKLPFVFCECFDIEIEDNVVILAFMNVFPSEGGTWITVSTYEEGKAFIELLRKYKNEKKINEILQIVVDQIGLQGSNIYFKEDYIKSLTEEEKAILYYAFTLNGAVRIAESLEEKYFSNYNDEAIWDLYFNTLIKNFK